MSGLWHPNQASFFFIVTLTLPNLNPTTPAPKIRMARLVISSRQELFSGKSNRHFDLLEKRGNRYLYHFSFACSIVVVESSNQCEVKG